MIAPAADDLGGVLIIVCACSKHCKVCKNILLIKRMVTNYYIIETSMEMKYTAILNILNILKLATPISDKRVFLGKSPYRALLGKSKA